MIQTQTPINDYDFALPDERIAQTPAIPRESAKLMVLDRQTGTIEHHHVYDLPVFFKSGDVVVINNTKVFKARLLGEIINDGQTHTVEILLSKPLDTYTWLAIGKPGKKLKPNIRIDIAENFSVIIVEHHTSQTLIVKFEEPTDKIMELANRYGHVPNPPYIKHEPNSSDYQTSYAKILGSAAAPTAGFHLTPHIRQQLTQKGVEIHEITLHVGLGTFLPVKSEFIEDHTMHSEWVNITAEVTSAINKAKSEHRRIIAVGTTSVRTLEGIAALHNGQLIPYTGDIKLFIKPGFQFHIMDAMLTNFHTPKSTLVILVSAFAGREKILHAYDQAIKNDYRFFSFGDAMLII